MAEEANAYGSSAYTEPWISSSAEGGVRYNNNNWIILKSSDSTVMYGPEFSTEDCTNNCPIVYFDEKGNKRSFEGGNVILVRKVISYGHNALQIWIDKKVKGGMNALYDVNLDNGTFFGDMGILPS
jgi:hypothetical protein